MPYQPPDSHRAVIRLDHYRLIIGIERMTGQPKIYMEPGTTNADAIRALNYLLNYLLEVSAPPPPRTRPPTPPTRRRPWPTRIEE